MNRGSLPWFLYREYLRLSMLVGVNGRCITKNLSRTTCGQSADSKKKGFRLERRKPLVLYDLIGCGGQI